MDGMRVIRPSEMAVGWIPLINGFATISFRAWLKKRLAIHLVICTNICINGEISQSMCAQKKVVIIAGPKEPAKLRLRESIFPRKPIVLIS